VKVVAREPKQQKGGVGGGGGAVGILKWKGKAQTMKKVTRCEGMKAAHTKLTISMKATSRFKVQR
jgi:hypothetical protein